MMYARVHRKHDARTPGTTGHSESRLTNLERRASRWRTISSTAVVQWPGVSTYSTDPAGAATTRRGASVQK